MPSKKLLFPPIFFLLVSCNEKQRKFDTWITRVAEFEQNQDSVKELGFKEIRYQEIAAEFANQYSPKGAEKLDSVPIDIIKTFTHLRTINKDSHEKYVSLIFTKLYAEHLKCCHQSYVIAEFQSTGTKMDMDKPSMIREFAFMSGYLDKEELPEIWTSGIIEKWLAENPRLLDFEPIEKHHTLIKEISKKIENGEYWKN